MKTIIALAGFLLSVPAFPATRAFYVKVLVDAPPEQQAALETAICRELRRSPDVLITNDHPDYRVSLSCMNIDTEARLACSLLITMPADVEPFKARVRPQSEVGWKDLKQAYDPMNIDLYEDLYLVGFSKVDWLAGKVADDLNKHCLEEVRRLIAQAQRDAEERPR